VVQDYGYSTASQTLKKLDLYIIAKHLKTFFFTALLFTIIAVAIDYSEKISKIIQHDLSFMEVMRFRYFSYIPWINGELWPLFALITVIFVASRLANNSEVISILGAGVSFGRYLRPFLLASLLLSVLYGIGRHLVIPQSNKTYRFYEAKYFWPREQKVINSDIHIFLDPNSKVHVRTFRKQDTTLLNARLETFEDGRLTQLQKVKKIKWLGEPNRWQMEDVEVRRIDGDEEELILPSDKKKKSKIIIDTTLNLHPNDFVKYNSQREMMTTPQLVEYIDYEKAKGVGPTKNFEIEILRRTSDPMTMIILTIIGASIASRKKRGGIGVNLAIGVALGALYIVISKFSQTFAVNSNLPPVLGVWLPNIVFTVVAIISYLKAQK